MPVKPDAGKVKVVDASAMGALIFAEPDAETVADGLTGGVLAAPALLWFEMANVCRKKLERYPDRRAELLEAFELSQRIPVRLIEVDLLQVVYLAEETGLTAYDASYLWLTRNIDGTLVTLDRMMKNAAVQVNVKAWDIT